MLSFGIYKKQLLFYLILLPLLVLAGFWIKNQFSSASVTNVSTPTSSNNYVVDVEIKKNAQVLINGQVTKKLLHIGEDYDLFRYLAAEEEGTYIESIEITVHLPEGAKKNEIKPVIYAVHGVGSSDFYQSDDQTIIYQASNLSPNASFTVTAQLPSGLVEFPFWSRFAYELTNMNVYWWLIISAIPFILVLFYLLLVIHQTLSDWKLPDIKEMDQTPPSNLPVAELAILTEGKVTNRAIAAILVDLAQRNYLNIIAKDGDFSFGKRKPLDFQAIENSPDLKSYEKILLEKIFSSEKIASGQKDILFRISHHIFSRKIARVYIEIYQAAQDKGFFSKDPVQRYRHFRIFGLVLFFLGFFGLIAGVILAIEPKFFLIFWLMLMMTSLLINKLAPNMPIKSDYGRKELLKWLRFKNYLTSPELIESNRVGSKLYEKYLPYAIALDCEVEWAKRFLNTNFMVPDWYISMSPAVIIEDFTRGLYPIIGSVSKTLTLSREPII